MESSMDEDFQLSRNTEIFIDHFCGSSTLCNDDELKTIISTGLLHLRQLIKANRPGVRQTGTHRYGKLCERASHTQ